MLSDKKQSELNHIIRDIYKTSLNSYLWEHLMQLIGDQFHSHIGANLSQQSSGKTTILQSFGATQEQEKAYAEYYGPRSLCGIEAILSKSNELILTDNIVNNYYEFIKSETYNDFLVKQLDGAHGLFLIAERSKNYVSYISLRRSSKQGAYNQDQIEIAKILQPHLTQANQVARQLDFKDHLINTFESAFNKLSTGIILIDTKKTVVFCNDAAEAVFNRADGLSIKQQKLIAPNPCDNAYLNEAIKKAFSINRDAKTLDAKNTCVIKRKRNTEPYRILVIPLDESTAPIKHNDSLALAIINDPDCQVMSCEDMIATLYGLTPTEARVVQAYCNGLTTAEIASLLKTSDNAVRFHTKNILKKLHVKRQSEIVSLVLRGPLSLMLKQQQI